MEKTVILYMGPELFGMRIFRGNFASRGLLRGICPIPAISRWHRPSVSVWMCYGSRPIRPVRKPYVQQTRLLQSAASAPSAPSDDLKPPTETQAGAEELPAACPGCGALTQWIEPEEAGHYDLSRKPIRRYIREILSARQRDRVAEERKYKKHNGDSAEEHLTETGTDENGGSTSDAQAVSGTVDDVSLQDSAAELASESGDQNGSQVDAEDPTDETSSVPSSKSYGKGAELNLRASLPPPVCDRCHDLVHHNRASPIPVPPVSYIRDVMDESPYDDNHVFHVVDAADFPLSLIPNIHRHLAVQEQRTKNRRSKPTKYRSSNKLAPLNIIITRSDLLAPGSEQADNIMHDVMNVLRDAMGPKGNKIRLGNVRMVSAHRGWWTVEVKRQIWNNGGAIWMVGKTNVGKSKLINSVFPKSPIGLAKGNGVRLPNKNSAPGQLGVDAQDTDPDTLLPPPQKYVRFPVLPVVSYTPSTTASPIRIPFGSGRGEVIDLPGLQRGGLGEFVHDDHKLDLIMKTRLKPDRLTIKPGQSLLLDGLIRITNLDSDIDILVAPFITLQSHVTSTKKAQSMEAGNREYPFQCIATDMARDQLASAGEFELKWDVTRTYGLKPGENPKRKDPGHIPLYRMMALDLLIEGSGWIELVCQVRTKDRAPDDFPKVEVFTPQGRCVGSRMTLRTWSFLGEKEKIDDKKEKKARNVKR